MSNLTPKQEKFCQCVAQGSTYSDAYRQAYDCKKMKMNTINNNACKMMLNSYITARIEEIKAKTSEKLVYTALESFNKLCEIQAEAVKKGDRKSALRAEELKGKLAHLYVEKSDVVLSGAVNILPTVKIDGKEVNYDV